MSLADKPCVPCRGGVPPMERSRAEAMLAELEPGWQLNAEGHLERVYPFKNFVQSLEFADLVGELERLDEVLERIDPLQVSFGVQLPARLELRQHRFRARPFHRRHAPPARHAWLVCKTHAVLLPRPVSPLHAPRQSIMGRHNCDRFRRCSLRSPGKFRGSSIGCSKRKPRLKRSG